MSEADWTPPQVAQLVPGALDELSARLVAEVRQLILELTLGIAIDFETHGLISQALLDQLAARADAIIDGIRGPVARAIANSYVNGLSVPQTAEAILAAVDDLRPWQATMLARNDLVSLANGGSYIAARALAQADPTGPRMLKRWVTAEDERVRPTHVEANGQTVPLDTPFVVGGATLRYPGDPQGPDAEVINCRCTQVYVEESGIEETTRPSRRVGDLLTLPSRSIHGVFADIQRLTPKLSDLHTVRDAAMPVRVKIQNLGQGVNGRYRYSPSGPVDLVISPTANRPALTLAHEVGHYVDNQHLGENNGDGSLRRVPALDGWWDAIDRSDAVRQLRDALANPPASIASDPAALRVFQRHLSYLLGRDELFARSYAQWVARRIDDAQLADELMRAQLAQDVPRQWADNDFEPVAAALDALFGVQRS